MASEASQDPDRIYLEPAPGGPEGRTWSEDDVWPLDVWPPEDRDDRSGVEYIRADLHAAEIARLARELEEAEQRYLSAVHGRGEFRDAYREALERERVLREALGEIREIPRDDTSPEVAHFAVRRIVDRALATPPAEGDGKA